MVKLAFEKLESVTYKRYNLLNRVQEEGKTLEDLLAAPNAQDDRLDFGTWKLSLFEIFSFREWEMLHYKTR